MRLRIPRNKLRNNSIHILGDQSDFVLPVGFSLIAYSIKLLDLLQCASQRLDVRLQAT
jgi:hypothetical protein